MFNSITMILFWLEKSVQITWFWWWCLGKWNTPPPPTTGHHFYWWKLWETIVFSRLEPQILTRKDPEIRNSSGKKWNFGDMEDWWRYEFCSHFIKILPKFYLWKFFREARMCLLYMQKNAGRVQNSRARSSERCLSWSSTQRLQSQLQTTQDHPCAVPQSAKL